VLAGGGLLDVDLESDVGSEDENGFTWRLGGGFDFYQTENVVLNIEAVYYLPTGDVRDFDFVTIGLGAQYRF
jgi:opacity protein-like surface antigen